MRGLKRPMRIGPVRGLRKRGRREGGACVQVEEGAVIKLRSGGRGGDVGESRLGPDKIGGLDFGARQYGGPR